jgi:hypothetical protein
LFERVQKGSYKILVARGLDLKQGDTILIKHENIFCYSNEEECTVESYEYDTGILNL